MQASELPMFCDHQCTVTMTPAQPSGLPKALAGMSPADKACLIVMHNESR